MIGDLVQLTRARAQETPERPAHAFLSDGDVRGARLSHTCAELDRRARAIAAHLQRDLEPGARVVLLYPPGLDFIQGFLGCLYAGLVAVPVFPPDPARLERTLPRFHAVLRDAEPSAWMSTELLRSNVAGAFLDADTLLLSSDAVPDDDAERWSPPRIDGDDAALLQYTSGSTRAPRGVILSHANLLHNLAAIAERFGSHAGSQGVIWLPPYHDMGLIGGILQPIFAGFPVTLMSPLAFMTRPLRWLEAISAEGATISGGPNFAYELCARRAEHHGLPEGLDLSHWEVAFNGSESVRAETLERFSRVFAPCGFRHRAHYPCYGLAEATLMVTGGAHHAPPRLLDVDAEALEANQVRAPSASTTHVRTLVSCGAAIDGTTLTLDATREEDIGEICVSGPSVSRGYWRGELERDEEGRLRTGDLGFLRGGELFVTGRLKELIIIAGRNHYPQDIERSVAAAHPAIRPGCVAAFSVEEGARERLVITAELRRDTRVGDDAAIEQALRSRIQAEHGLRPHRIELLRDRRVPKTSSGKIIRHLAREQHLRG